MALRYSAPKQPCGAELRAWLAATLPSVGAPPPHDDWPARRAYDLRWQRLLFEAGDAGGGWAGGGRGGGLAGRGRRTRFLARGAADLQGGVRARRRAVRGGELRRVAARGP